MVNAARWLASPRVLGLPLVAAFAFLATGCLGYAPEGTVATPPPPSSDGSTSRLPALLSQLQAGGAAVEVFDGSQSQVLAAQDEQAKAAGGEGDPTPTETVAGAATPGPQPSATPTPGSIGLAQPTPTPTPAPTGTPAATVTPGTPTATPTVAPTATPADTPSPTIPSEGDPPAEGGLPPTEG